MELLSIRCEDSQTQTRDIVVSELKNRGYYRPIAQTPKLDNAERLGQKVGPTNGPIQSVDTNIQNLILQTISAL